MTRKMQRQPTVRIDKRRVQALVDEVAAARVQRAGYMGHAAQALGAASKANAEGDTAAVEKHILYALEILPRMV